MEPDESRNPGDSPPMRPRMPLWVLLALDAAAIAALVCVCCLIWR